jgi:RNase P subunit RPR2
LLPGRTSRTRLRGKSLNLTCLKCGMVHRYPYRARTT